MKTKGKQRESVEDKEIVQILKEHEEGRKKTNEQGKRRQRSILK